MNKWTEDQLSFYDSYIEMLNENLEITECMENIETNVKGFLVVDKLAGFTEETVEAALGEEGKNTVDSDMVLTLTLCKLANEFFGERLDAYIDYLQANPEAGNIGAEVFVNRLQVIIRVVKDYISNTFLSACERCGSFLDEKRIEEAKLLFTEAMRQVSLRLDAGYEFFVYKNIVRSGYTRFRQVEPYLSSEMNKAVNDLTELYIMEDNLDREYLSGTFSVLCFKELAAAIEPVEWDGTMFSPEYDEAWQIMSNVLHNIYVTIFDALERVEEMIIKQKLPSEYFGKFRSEFYEMVALSGLGACQIILRQLRMQSKSQGKYTFWKNED